MNGFFENAFKNVSYKISVYIKDPSKSTAIGFI
jgi:hypothetical protein